MKIFNLITVAGAAGLILFGATISVAQNKNQTPKKSIQTQKPVPFEIKSVSGLDLIPNVKTGTFLITFQQQLPVMGNLTLTNYKGQVLHQEQLIPQSDSTITRTIDVGNLKAGLYNIEVKADNTLYWKKVRIRR